MVQASLTAAPAAMRETLLLQGRSSVLQPERDRQRALEGESVAMASAPVGTRTSVQICRTATELRRSLEGEFGLSASLGPLPLIGLRRTFQESLHTTSFSLSLVLRARRVLEGLEVQEPRLRADLVLPQTPEQLDKFVALHGDSWVRGVLRGAEVQGVFTLYAQSQQEAESLAQSLQAILPVQGVSLTPQFSQKLSQLSSSSGVNVNLNFQVLGVRQPPLSTPEQLLAFISGFGSLPIDQPVPLALDCRGYEEIAELLPLFDPVVRNRLLFLGDPARPSAAGLLQRQLCLREIANQCRWVEDTYKLYGQTPDPSLRTNADRVRADLATIESLTVAFTKSASTPLNDPDLSALSLGSPRLAPRLLDGERLGGDGGQPFEFTDRFKAIARRRRLAGVALNAGKLIDQIRLTYVQEPDALSATSLPRQWTEAHGGTGGDDRGRLELDLANHEQILTLKANTGTGVDQLEFISSGGRRLSGGRPSNGGRASSWTPGPQQVLLGFQGRAKTWLDALQPVIADFSGALHWEPLRLEGNGSTPE
ncbi:MAG: jacalin-like lectin [Synechococcaceae cyanobacterium]